MSHPQLDRFRAQFSEDRPTEDAYNLGLLDGASSEVRGDAEDALIAQAMDQFDPRAVTTLAEMGSEKARPTLEVLAGLNGDVAEAARRALVRLGGAGPAAHAEAVRSVAADALGAGAVMSRFAAVYELGREGAGADALPTLLAALEDDDHLVRSQAFDGVLTHLDLVPLIQNAAGTDVELRSPLKRLQLLVESRLPTLQRLGAEGIREVAARLQGGESVDDLDLRYAPTGDAAFLSDLSDALQEPGDPLPGEALRAATGHDRAWAEAILAVQLEPKRSDPRAARALADLGASWAVPTLELARTHATASTPFADALDEALATLSPPTT